MHKRLSRQQKVIRQLARKESQSTHIRDMRIKRKDDRDEVPSLRDEIIVSELGRRQRRFSATIGSRNDNFLRGFSDFGCSLNIPTAPPPPPPPPTLPPPPLALPLPILLVLELPVILSYKTVELGRSYEPKLSVSDLRR
uniref:Uncharacterized protein n=1 Tax=Glossina austeni TaxID=7395 RepID=A0A1A9UG03_GLOAU